MFAKTPVRAQPSNIHIHSRGEMSSGICSWGRCELREGVCIRHACHVWLNYRYLHNADIISIISNKRPHTRRANQRDSHRPLRIPNDAVVLPFVGKGTLFAEKIINFPIDDTKGTKTRCWKPGFFIIYTSSRSGKPVRNFVAGNAQTTNSRKILVNWFMRYGTFMPDSSSTTSTMALWTANFNLILPKEPQQGSQSCLGGTSWGLDTPWGRIICSVWQEVLDWSYFVSFP